MKKAFATFVAEPTGEHYLVARDAALKISRTNVSSRDFSRLTQLADSQLFADLMHAIEDLPPSAQLSPRAHYLAWMAAEQMRDDEEAELERYLFAACIRGILETGCGSPEAPYRITHVSDEYDVLLALGRESVSQRLIERDGRAFDVLRCDDGQELWFELGSFSAAPQPAPKPRKPAKKRHIRVVK
jgi:hypothetical protein